MERRCSVVYTKPSVVYACSRGGQLHLFLGINLIPTLESCKVEGHLSFDPLILLCSLFALSEKPVQCPQDGKTRSETAVSIPITLTTLHITQDFANN